MLKEKPNKQKALHFMIHDPEKVSPTPAHLRPASWALLLSMMLSFEQKQGSLSRGDFSEELKIRNISREQRATEVFCSVPSGDGQWSSLEGDEASRRTDDDRTKDLFSLVIFIFRFKERKSFVDSSVVIIVLQWEEWPLFYK